MPDVPEEPTSLEGGSGAREASFVALGAFFTATGVWMAASGRGGRIGIAIAAFFGLCLAVAVWLVLEKRAVRTSLAARSVRIVGSVPFRVRVGRGVLLLAAVAAVMLVVAWAAAGTAMSPFAALAAALCIALVPVVLFGPPSRRAVVFEPGGLRLVEPSYEVCLPWDEIADARIVDVHDTLVVALRLRDPEALVPIPRAGRADPAAALRRLARGVAMNRAFYGCDVSIGPVALGLDAVLFLRAVETYVADPGARAALAPRAALEAAR